MPPNPQFISKGGQAQDLPPPSQLWCIIQVRLTTLAIAAV